MWTDLAQQGDAGVQIRGAGPRPQPPGTRGRLVPLMKDFPVTPVALPGPPGCMQLERFLPNAGSSRNMQGSPGSHAQPAPPMSGLGPGMCHTHTCCQEVCGLLRCHSRHLPGVRAPMWTAAAPCRPRALGSAPHRVQGAARLPWGGGHPSLLSLNPRGTSHPLPSPEQHLPLGQGQGQHVWARGPLYTCAQVWARGPVTRMCTHITELSGVHQR